VFATDAISAVSVAKKEQPDLLLLDLGLPGGDGLAVMQRLAALTPISHIPVVVVSGRDRTSFEDPVVQAGARAFLQKPFTVDELLAAVHDALGDA